MPRHSAPHNRLGYALQLCALRFMGFVPDDLTSAPPEAVAFVAQQLAVEPDVLAAYGARAQTRRTICTAIQTHLGYRKARRKDLEGLAAWLLERALEHDKPTLLYELLCEKLRTDQLLRPGVTRLERLVAEARTRAQTETFRQLTPMLTADRKQWLDSLLQPDPTRGFTPLTWLRRPAVSNSPRAILGNLEKLTFLRSAGVEDWALEPLNPNRLKFLAHLARKSSAQALQRAPAERRYPILVAFLSQALADVTDEVIEMFDRCLAEAYARAGQDLEDFRKAMAQATNEKVHLFRELARAVLDPAIARSQPPQHHLPTHYARPCCAGPPRNPTALCAPWTIAILISSRRAMAICGSLPRPSWRPLPSTPISSPEPLLEAVDLLQQLNTTHRRTVPPEAPTDFVPMKWRPYVVDPDGHIDRHYYELCTLWELRGALRAGNVWVPSSRRYANPETYLIPKASWPALRPDICQQLHAPENGAVRLEERGRELTELLPRVDRLLARNGKVGEVRMEKGRVVVPPLEAEERPAECHTPGGGRDVAPAPDRLARPPHRSGPMDRLQPPPAPSQWP